MAFKKTISMAPCGSGRKPTFACAFVSDRRAYGPNNLDIFSANSANRSDQLYFCAFDAGKGVNGSNKAAAHMEAMAGCAA
jgi:hypothetical protein